MDKLVNKHGCFRYLCMYVRKGRGMRHEFHADKATPHAATQPAKQLKKDMSNRTQKDIIAGRGPPSLLISVYEQVSLGYSQFSPVCKRLR